MEQYFEKLRERIDEIAANPEPINRPPKCAPTRWRTAAIPDAFDSGHMVSSELVNRAGGLVAMSGLTFNFET